MRRSNENYNGIELTQINKTVAKRLFNEGKSIYLLPCNIQLNNMWVNPHVIESKKYVGENNFDALVDSFEYYNCNNNQMGLYSHFLIKVSDKTA